MEEEIQNYTVYWYRRPNYTNPYTEGYIGITNDMQRRNLEHLRNTKFSHFTNALKLYSDIEYIILHSKISQKEASDLEYAYRSLPNIGWNSAVGGIDTLATLSQPVTLYHESDCNKLYSFPSIAKAAEELDLGSARISQAILRGRQQYGYDGWAIMLDESMDRTLTKSISELRSELLKGIPKTKPSIFKGMTNRWTEEQKEAISKFHKGKVISEEQRKITGAKNRVNPNLCKQVTLKHKNSEKEYVFHSISEASRQLNIPLSRLKSKAQRSLNTYGKDGWAIINLGS